jgi:hypothetical protein
MKFGADFNYTENENIDLLCFNKILMDKIYLGIKQERLCDEYSRSTNSNNQSMELSISKKIRSSFGTINYKSIFSTIIKDDNISNDLGDLREYHSKIIYVHNNIIEKIQSDHTIRPLRIFWIKSDYFLLTKILTLMSGGVFMALSYFLNNFFNSFKIR